MKLLNKSLRAYLIFSVFVLLISVPVFYYKIKSIVIEDVDEDLIAQKMGMVPNIERVISTNPIESLQAFEPDFYIKPVNYIKNDTIYNSIEYDASSKENVPHRILQTSIVLNGQPYLIKIKRSLVDNDNLIANIVMVQTILLAFIIVGMLLITLHYSKKLWRPFYTTLDKLQTYKIESENAIQLEKTDVDEFSALNKTINNLTIRNHQVYLSQKEFTENASHEMQTPLAVFQSKVELLMQTSPLTNEQAELIAGLSQAGQRMNRLNKTLLLLAKIDSKQFTETEQVNIDKTVQKLADQYKNAQSQKNISMHTKIHADVSIEANQTLMEILIGNLLSNAIRHNVQGGTINIFIDKTRFTISNSGRSTSLDTSRLFQRFQKQSADSNSLGLGLEMVKRICNLYNAEISYSFAECLHSFSVSFNNY